MEMHADAEDVVQAEEVYDPTRPINVTVCGPTEVRELPAVRSGYRTETGAGTAVGVRLLGFEPKRKGAVIIALTQDIYISNSQAGAQSAGSGAARIPALVPFPVSHLDEVWACAVSGATDISVITEYWTE